MRERINVEDGTRCINIFAVAARRTDSITYQPRFENMPFGINGVPKGTNFETLARHPSADFPLRGAVICGHCDTPFTANWSTGRGVQYPYYVCRGRGCEIYGKSIRREVIEAEFATLLSRLRSSQSLNSAAQAILKNLWDRNITLARERATASKAELSQTERHLSQLINRAANANIPSVVAAYEVRIDALEGRTTLLRARMSTADRPLRSFDETVATALDFLAKPLTLWHSHRLEDKRMVLKLAFGERLTYVRSKGFTSPTVSSPFENTEPISNGSGQFTNC